MKGIRLQVVLARAGLASRRAAEKMMEAGRVSVNGRVVTEPGVCVDPEADEIRVDGRLVGKPESKVYLLFHKPGRCVTSLRDPQGRKTVLDFVRERSVRIFPVGRLDYDAEGLLLLTNDGTLAHRLQHPRYGVPKTYQVKVKGHPGETALGTLRNGVRLEEGITAAAEVSVIRRLPGASWLKIVLHQGWYRQIKRMCDAVGHPVLKIRRTDYGPLSLAGLPPGRYRPLRRDEIVGLYRCVHLPDEQGPDP
ncbi:MAG: rRNA pseudouridine synthase [Deltaproteobacteria bacterium]|nr:rRNA pseudouridine synthase [Deltaproteobacteria bacterium]